MTFMLFYLEHNFLFMSKIWRRSYKYPHNLDI